jgi:hypothetical protein
MVLLFSTYLLLGVGRGVTGRLFSLTTGREFEFRTSRRFTFTLLRGVVFALIVPTFAGGLFAFSGLFVLPFAFLLALALSFVFFGFGRFGLFSLLFVLVFRFSLGSSGITFSGDSPAFARRLRSMATV